RDSKQEPFAEHSRLAVSARTGADRLRQPELVCALPTEGYAGRDRAEASQCHDRRHGHAVDARTAQYGRVRPGWLRAEVAGISCTICRRGDQEMGSPDQVQRRSVLTATQPERRIALHVI